MKKQIRVLAVLPYEGLREMLISAAEQYKEIRLDVIVADMEEGVKKAKEFARDTNFDVIVSRGGTAALLQKEFTKKVVLPIPVTFEDIFRAVLLAKNYNEKFAIVSLPSIAAIANEFCDMLQYNIKVYAVNGEMEAGDLLEELRGQGYSMIVGDMINARLAMEKSMNVVMITSGKGSVEMVLKQITQMQMIVNNKAEEQEYLWSICRTAPWYIAIMDRNGEIVLDNIRNKEGKQEYISWLKEHADALFERESCHLECRIGNELYFVDSEKIQGTTAEQVVVHGRCVFIEEPEKNQGIMLDEERDEDSYIFENSMGVCSTVGRIRETVMKCCETRLPVLILGEAGSGKDAVAHNIYRLGNHSRPYYIVDCKNVTQKEWFRFFERPTSPLMETNCTIYFKNIQVINSGLEKRLRDMIENTNLCKRNRVIFSGVIKKEPSECAMAEYLLEKVKCILLQAQPLRERKDDILNLSIIYLSAMNAELGKQIIGFEQEAGEEMVRYSWPGNIAQLKRVLREMVLCTQGSYITKKIVKECISNEIFSNPEIDVSNINLKQSLEDITFDIVRQVMKEEGMNQKRTAERLGVSRTTVWRILKARE